MEDNYVDLGRKQAKKRYKTTQGDRNTKGSNLNLKMTNGFFNIKARGMGGLSQYKIYHARFNFIFSLKYDIFAITHHIVLYSQMINTN